MKNENEKTRITESRMIRGPFTRVETRNADQANISITCVPELVIIYGPDWTVMLYEGEL